jgi:CHAT domain-containing protein
MEAYQLCAELGDLRRQGRTLSNIGQAYLALGQPQRALGFLERALPLRQQTKDWRGEDTTLNNMGLAHARLGQLDQALKLFQQALEMRRQRQDRRDIATTLTYLGEVLTLSGQNERALAALSESLDLRRQIGDPLRVGTTLTILGQAEAAQGHHEQAKKHLSEAIATARELASEEQQLIALGTLAQVCLHAGDVHKSMTHTMAAIDLVESRRVNIPSPELRAFYLASRQDPYQLAVSAHMQLHRQEPAAGHARAALAINERRRARSLIDLLIEAGVEIRHGIAPSLLEQRDRLQERLRELATNYQSARVRDEADRQGRLESRLEVVRTELAVVESKIRKQSPVYDDITRPKPLDARQIMALLDRDTLLLEYALGDDASLLWAVTDQAVQAFVLPPRTQIESTARDLHQAWSTRDIGASREEAVAAQRLSDLVVAPVAELLDHSNLVIVADGALHYIPFGALPQPGSRSPLLVKHTVSHLPSASVLAVQRRRLATRPPTAKLLAVLADPVFGQNDPRLAKTSGEYELKTDSAELQRLPASRHEAEAVLGLVTEGQAYSALGLDASREAIVNGQFDSYRYIHLATHGVLDSDHPELSGLVLSMLDDAGRPRDGILRLHDIYNLQLQADLVVLSGCRTALGQELRGEGLVGLSRGFLSAGTRGVVASLWQVQDRATAELMIHLYRALLVSGASPSQALRQAQLRILKDRRWRDPYYWAGFVLIGDWQ